MLFHSFGMQEVWGCVTSSMRMYLCNISGRGECLLYYVEATVHQYHKGSFSQWLAKGVPGELGLRWGEGAGGEAKWKELGFKCTSPHIK